jgi:hypothetical protein
MNTCGGWRRYGGAFTLSPIKWEKCKETPTVMLWFKQHGRVDVMPACNECWAECINTGITITRAEPIKVEE